jgi:hypothetical protein
MFGLGLPELIVVFVVAVFVIPVIFYLLTLQKALALCSPDSRTVAPGLVWLLLIPLFNLIWNFIVVVAISKSLHNEFLNRKMNESPTPGQGVGLAMCILSVVSAIPYLRAPVGVAMLICWIIYWVKIAGYSTKLEHSTNTPTAL